MRGPSSRRAWRALTSRGEIVRIEIRRPDGSIVVANDPSLAGASTPADAGIRGIARRDRPGGHRSGRDVGRRAW